MKFWAVDLAHYFLNGHPHLSSKKYVHDRISGQTLVCVVPITIFRAGKKYLLFQQKSAMIVELCVCRYEVFLIFIEQSSSKNSRNFSFFYVDLEWCGVFDTSRTYKFSPYMPHYVEKCEILFCIQMINNVWQPAHTMAKSYIESDPNIKRSCNGPSHLVFLDIKQISSFLSVAKEIEICLTSST